MPAAVVTVTVRAPVAAVGSSTKLAVNERGAAHDDGVDGHAAAGDGHRRAADDEVCAGQGDWHRGALDALIRRDARQRRRPRRRRIDGKRQCVARSTCRRHGHVSGTGRSIDGNGEGDSQRRGADFTDVTGRDSGPAHRDRCPEAGSGQGYVDRAAGISVGRSDGGEGRSRPRTGRLSFQGRGRHHRENRRQHRRGHATAEQPPPGGGRPSASRLDRQFQQVNARELPECQVDDRIGLGDAHLHAQDGGDRVGTRGTVTLPPHARRGRIEGVYVRPRPVVHRCFIAQLLGVRGARLSWIHQIAPRPRGKRTAWRTQLPANREHGDPPPRPPPPPPPLTACSQNPGPSASGFPRAATVARISAPPPPTFVRRYRGQEPALTSMTILSALPAGRGLRSDGSHRALLHLL